jgi:hypothetical protein
LAFGANVGGSNPPGAVYIVSYKRKGEVEPWGKSGDARFDRSVGRFHLFLR